IVATNSICTHTKSRKTAPRSLTVADKRPPTVAARHVTPKEPVMSSTALRPSRLLTYVTGLALGISAAAVPASADPAPASIEDSHSFAGWTQRIRTGTDATFVADTNTATDGGTSLRIDNATPRGPNLYAELFQDVPVTPETTYQLSASVRGENLPDAAAVLITSNDW